MKPKTTRLFTLVSLLLLASFLVSCAAPAAQPAAPAAPAAQEPAAQAPSEPAAKEFSGELTFWSGYSEFKPFYDTVVADFQAKYPKVKVNVLIAASLRDHEQKLASAIPTDTGPDVYEGSLYVNAKFVDANLMPALPQWVVDRTQGYWDQWITDYFTLNGTRYVVPFFEGRAAIFYNKDCFKEAGLPEPASDKPMEWEAFIDAAKKMTKYDASGKVTRSGFGLRRSGQGSGVGEKWWIFGYPRGQDTWTVDANGKYMVNINSEGAQKNLQTYMDMLYNWKTDSIDLPQDAQAFQAGVSCMFQRETWVIGDMAKKAPDINYGTMPMPKDARWGTLRNPMGFWVTKSAKDPDLAYEFALFMVQPQYQQLLLDTVGWLPSRQDVDFSAILEKKPAFKAFLVNDPEYKFYRYPPIGVFDEIQTKYSERLVNAYLDPSLANDPAAIKALLDEANAEGNAILKREKLGGE